MSELIEPKPVQDDQKPKPSAPKPKDPDSPDKPWGDDFDAERAWNLTQNLRGDKTKLQTQIDELQGQLDAMKNERLTDEQKATKDAIEQAKADAEAVVRNEMGPKYLKSELKGIAAGVIRDKKQLDSFMEMVDPKKFVGEDGEIDEEKVMGHLTTIYVGDGDEQSPSSRRKPPNWGQNSGHQPPEKAGSAGRAALEKRHGVKNSS